MAEQVDELCKVFTKAGLERECEKRGLSREGCKKEMAQRVAYHDMTLVANDGRVRADGEVRDGVQHNDGGNDGPHDDGGIGGRNDEGDDHENDGNSADGGVHRNDGGIDDATEDEDDDNDDANDGSSDGGHSCVSESSSKFLTALTRDRRMSTPKDRDRVTTERRQPYSFRDVEDSIDTFGAEDGQDVKLWMSQFEAMSRTALWNDEQKLIMCRKKMTGTARRFMFAQRDLTSFAKLKSALIKEFAPFIRASDVHRQLAARKRKPNEAIRDYIYEMQRIALSIDLDEPSICEYVVDGITDDEFHRSLLYEAQTIRQLKEKLLNFEKVQKKSGAKPKPHEGQKKKDQREKECKKSSEKLGSKKHCFNCGDSAHAADRKSVV